MKQLEIYIDGASKGNPGPAGVGVIICQGQEVLKNVYSFIGEATNNVAEYSALIYALQEALLMKAQTLKVHTDSELLYRQMRKEYKIKSQNIIGLYNQALHLMAGFKDVSFKQIPREANRGADKLATKAIKEALQKRT